MFARRFSILLLLAGSFCYSGTLAARNAGIPQYSAYVMYQTSGRLLTAIGQPASPTELTARTNLASFGVAGGSNGGVLNIDSRVLSASGTGLDVKIDVTSNENGHHESKTVVTFVGYGQQKDISLTKDLKCHLTVGDSSSAKFLMLSEKAARDRAKSGDAAAFSLAGEVQGAESIDAIPYHDPATIAAYMVGYASAKGTTSLVIDTPPGRLAEARILAQECTMAGANVAFCTWERH
ncbi:MAG TPA: hypothetical protein VHY22_12430 [Chthoniobacteraceae bacterium]|jgi:hypothetical protein|nr:hypothetical protein [Chthoniobacteraceae bacterium]